MEQERHWVEHEASNTQNQKVSTASIIVVESLSNTECLHGNKLIFHIVIHLEQETGFGVLESYSEIVRRQYQESNWLLLNDDIITSDVISLVSITVFFARHVKTTK